MKVVGKEHIEDFCIRYSDVRSQLSAWMHEAEEASWAGPIDIKNRYSSASFMADNRVVFNLKGNRYRLDIKVSYKHQTIFIKRIGTHAEYLKWIF